MTQTKNIESQSLAKLTGFFDTVPEKITPYLERLMQQVLFLLQADLADYPSETEANRPGRLDEDGNPRSYYERGKGTWRPIKGKALFSQKVQLNKLGISLGRGTQQAPKGIKHLIEGYTLSPTSELLGKSWFTSVTTTPSGVLGSLSNSASYADYVQGFNQASIPASRDWPGVEEVIEKRMPDILSLADQMIDEFMKDSLESL